MHRAAEAAKWNPKHLTAKEWLDNVHDPYHDQSAQFAMMHPYFRAACDHGEDSCPAQKVVPLEKLASLSPEQRNLFRLERLDDAYISFGNSVRVALLRPDEASCCSRFASDWRYGMASSRWTCSEWSLLETARQRKRVAGSTR